MTERDPRWPPTPGLAAAVERIGRAYDSTEKKRGYAIRDHAEQRFRLPNMTNEEVAEACADLCQAVADLMDWAAIVGDWDAPCWTRARTVLDRIRDKRDAQEAPHGHI